MAFINYDTFVQNDTNGYLVLDGIVGDRANLSKAAHQLKIEADEIKTIVDIINGIMPEVWDINKTYRESQYVMYNGLIYRSDKDLNTDEPPLNWTQQNIIKAVGELLQGETV